MGSGWCSGILALNSAQVSVYGAVDERGNMYRRRGTNDLGDDDVAGGDTSPGATGFGRQQNTRAIFPTMARVPTLVTAAPAFPLCVQPSLERYSAIASARAMCST